MSLSDTEILKDTDPSYRVLNLNSPFLETNTSYYHKSIGGYHAAKLRRYQELIDFVCKERSSRSSPPCKRPSRRKDLMGVFAHCPSLNMLNARYIVYNQEQPPLRNPFAYGNAWFVGQVEMVGNADEEISALNTIDPLRVAVVNKRFADVLKGFTPVLDSTATIVLDSYSPSKLVYTSKTRMEQLAVFFRDLLSTGLAGYHRWEAGLSFPGGLDTPGDVDPCGRA